MNIEDVERHLRHLIIGLLHVGRLKPGDALPSIRGVADEVGADHRTVAGAYRALAAEGLVEIRPGSGVYLARDVAAEAVRSDTGAWLAEVLADGWSRRLSRGAMAELVRRCASARIRCACVESNQDQMTAVAAELRDDFSFDVAQVLVDPAADADAIPADPLARADLVVTTAFHAPAVREAAARAGKPCVVVRVNAGFAAEVARRLRHREVTAVVADRRYIARAEAFLAVTPHRGAVRFVLAADVARKDAPAVGLESDAVLVTREARRRLGLADFHLVPSPPPYLAPESARELYAAVVEHCREG